MVDKSYIVSLLGCANLIELVSVKQIEHFSRLLYARKSNFLIYLLSIDVACW